MNEYQSVYLSGCYRISKFVQKKKKEILFFRRHARINIGQMTTKRRRMENIVN